MAVDEDGVDEKVKADGDGEGYNRDITKSCTSPSIADKTLVRFGSGLFSARNFVDHGM